MSTGQLFSPRVSTPSLSKSLTSQRDLFTFRNEQDLFWITTNSGKTLHANCLSEDQQKSAITSGRGATDKSFPSIGEKEGTASVVQCACFDEYESPKRYEANIDPRSPRDTEAAEGCFKWSLKLRLPVGEVDPQYIYTGAAIRLSFLEKRCIVFCPSSSDGNGAQPYLARKMVESAADPQCIFIIESCNSSSEAVRWREPYLFRHLLSGRYLSIDLKRPQNKFGMWKPKMALGAAEQGPTEKFMLVPATIESDERVRADSAIGWLSVTLLGKQLELLSKGRAKGPKDTAASAASAAAAAAAAAAKQGITGLGSGIAGGIQQGITGIGGGLAGGIQQGITASGVGCCVPRKMLFHLKSRKRSKLYFCTMLISDLSIRR